MPTRKRLMRFLSSVPFRKQLGRPTWWVLYVGVSTSNMRPGPKGLVQSSDSRDRRQVALVARSPTIALAITRRTSMAVIRGCALQLTAGCGVVGCRGTPNLFATNCLATATIHGRLPPSGAAHQGRPARPTNAAQPGERRSPRSGSPDWLRLSMASVRVGTDASLVR
jgi:hypothetical protein